MRKLLVLCLVMLATFVAFEFLSAGAEAGKFGSVTVTTPAPPAKPPTDYTVRWAKGVGTDVNTLAAAINREIQINDAQAKSIAALEARVAALTLPAQVPEPKVFVHINRETQINWPDGSEQCKHITEGAWDSNEDDVIEPDRFRAMLFPGNGYVPLDFTGYVIIDLEKDHCTFDDYKVLCEIVREKVPNTRGVLAYYSTAMSRDVLDKTTQLYDGIWCQCHGTFELAHVRTWISTCKEFTDKHSKTLIVADMTYYVDKLGKAIEYTPQHVYSVLSVGREFGATKFGLFIDRTCGPQSLGQYPCAQWIQVCLDVAEGRPLVTN